MLLRGGNFSEGFQRVFWALSEGFLRELFVLNYTKASPPPLMRSASWPAESFPARCRRWSCRCGRRSPPWCPDGCSSAAPPMTRPWNQSRNTGMKPRQRLLLQSGWSTGGNINTLFNPKGHKVISELSSHLDQSRIWWVFILQQGLDLYRTLSANNTQKTSCRNDILSI